ncbi:PAS domain-containing protein [Sphingomonas solaris]|uniref:PAS domain-containing protein n=1 Tax=Alterirhizorhabdus solaris TaxID=2529389 RepID=UPI003B838255
MASSSRILESLQNPVLVVDANSEITYANATAAVRRDRGARVDTHVATVRQQTRVRSHSRSL